MKTLALSDKPFVFRPTIQDFIVLSSIEVDGSNAQIVKGKLFICSKKDSQEEVRILFSCRHPQSKNSSYILIRTSEGEEVCEFNPRVDQPTKLAGRLIVPKQYSVDMVMIIFAFILPKLIVQAYMFALNAEVYRKNGFNNHSLLWEFSYECDTLKDFSAITELMSL